MNSRQAAATLLRRLNLPEGTANVVVDDQHDPAELTVLVFCPPKPMLVVDEWEGTRFVYCLLALRQWPISTEMKPRTRGAFRSKLPFPRDQR